MSNLFKIRECILRQDKELEQSILDFFYSNNYVINNNQKKILFVIPHLGGGGAEKILIDILSKLDSEIFEITLLVLQNEGVYTNKIPSNIKTFYISDYIQLGYIFYYVKEDPEFFYNYVMENIVKEKFDVEVAFLEGYATKFIAYSTNKNSKKIAWVHIDMFTLHWTKPLFEEQEECCCYNKFDDVVFVSNDAREGFLKLFNNNSRNHVIYNPIISNNIINQSMEENIIFDKFTIISIGRLDYPKGFDRLIKAHAKLVKKYEHQLVILGEGRLKDELKNLINQLGVSDSVILKGFVANPYPYLKAADLFISSSLNEGYPLVVCEAIILEKPIICTNVSGSSEILDGKYGLLCDNSEEGILNSLEYVISNKEELISLKEKSKIGKKSLNYKKIIKEIESLLYTDK